MTSAEPMETRAAAGASAGTSGDAPSKTTAATKTAASEKVNDAILAPLLPAKPKFEAMSAFDANGRKIEFRRVRLVALV